MLIESTRAGCYEIPSSRKQELKTNIKRDFWIVTLRPERAVMRVSSNA